MLVCYDPARLLALVAEWLSEQQVFPAGGTTQLLPLAGYVPTGSNFCRAQGLAAR